jgi:pimeloyl-ACP methyl ester carboxylesterase
VSDPLPARLLLAPSRQRRHLLLGSALAHALLAAGWSAALLLAAAPAGLAAWLPVAAWLGAAAASALALRRGAALACTVLIEPAPREPAPRPDAATPPLRSRVLDNQGLRRLRALPRLRRTAAQAAVVRLRGARASYAGAARIVLHDRHQRVVVWRDATDRDTFRRLAAWARWRTGP